MAHRGARGAKRTMFTTLLAAGWSVSSAGRRVNVGRRTATRWANDPATLARIRELQTATTRRVLGFLTASLTLAVKRLRQLAMSNHTPTALRASCAILEQAIRIRDATEIEARLTALEAVARDSPPRACSASGFSPVSVDTDERTNGRTY